MQGNDGCFAMPMTGGAKVKFRGILDMMAILEGKPFVYKLSQHLAFVAFKVAQLIA